MSFTASTRPRPFVSTTIDLSRLPGVNTRLECFFLSENGERELHLTGTRLGLRELRERLAHSSATVVAARGDSGTGRVARGTLKQGDRLALLAGLSGPERRERVEAFADEARCGRISLFNHRRRLSYRRGFYAERGYEERTDVAHFGPVAEVFYYHPVFFCPV